MNKIFIIYEIPYEGRGFAECDTEKDAVEFLISFYEELRIKKDKRIINKIIKGTELSSELIIEEVTEVSKMVTNVLFEVLNKELT